MTATKRIPTLDGWRAIAILAVIGHHVAALLYDPSLWWVWRGVIGVDIFFAVSGLLITYQLLDDSNLKAFYIRRAFRILPPAVLYLAVVAALHLIDTQDLWHGLTMQINYFGASAYAGHFWSLSLEEQFYLVWPAALLLSKKRAPLVALLGIVAVCIWRTLIWGHAGMYYVRFETRCDGLLWGCVSAFVLRSRILKFSWMMPYLCLVIAVFAYGNRNLAPVMPVALSIMVLSTVQNPSWLLSRLLEWKPLVWIGQRSYGIYLWQTFFIIVPIHVPMLLRIGMAFVWAAFLYKYFEAPLRTIGRRLSSFAQAPSAELAITAMAVKCSGKS